MFKTLLGAVALSGIFILGAAEPVALPEPVFSARGTFADALKNRRTIRDFAPISEKEMPQIASTLLWSACGINRENGKKVVPAALARYAVKVYFADRHAVYLFDAAKNVLIPVTEEDVLPLCAGNPAIGQKASGAILFVIDQSVWGERHNDYAALEAGAMMQNVYLACASENLGTVACGSFNAGKLTETLKLSADCKLFLAMPFGRIAGTK